MTAPRRNSRKTQKPNGAKRIPAALSLDAARRALFGGWRLPFALALYAVICAAMLLREPGSVRVRVGDVAEQDILSPRTINYEDTDATKRRRDLAANETGLVYRVLPAFRADMDEAFRILQSPQFKEDSEAAASVRETLLGADLRESAVARIIALSPENSEKLQSAFNAALDRMSREGGISDKNLPLLNAVADDVARSEKLPEHLAPLLKELLRGAKGNLAVDQLATDAARKRAADAVRPEMRTLLEKESLVRRGERITDHHVTLLRKLGLLHGTVSLLRNAGLMVLAALMLFALGAYAKAFSPRVYREEKRMAIYFIIIGIAVVGAMALPLSMGYLLGLCIGALAILTCVLLDSGLALITAPMVTLVVALAAGLKLEHALTALACGFAAYFFAVRRNDRDSLIKAGLAVAAASMMTALVLTALQFNGARQALLDVALFGGLNGLGSFVIASGMLPVFEKLFNVTTTHRLLELSNPEEPLLKQLLIQAPGTYHHSIFVGNLAESAADLLGADTLLVRIASYYHDVGKLKRPYFYNENRMEGGSQLNDVSPTLGALVIAAHVKDGVEMARDKNLPPEVIAMIQEHHGTCLISFFYQQARAAAKNGDEVAPERFRYSGPRPSTLESALLMLADACEAAVRSQKEPTARNIENQVNAIFENRIMDKQFEECNITLKQLDQVRRTYIKMLVGVYHSRMEYPDLKDLEPNP